MKKIAIIGANDFQNPLILKAKELGYETHVFAWKDGSIGEKTADYFYPISIVEKEEILEKCKKIGICGITTIASDLATITVNYIAEKMNLPGNSIKCNIMSTNKYEMRKAFLENGIPTIKFKKISNLKELNNIDDMEFPLIVKPTDRSGSRAISKVYNYDDLNSAVRNAIESSFEKSAIVEEFIDGQEYSAEGITSNGKHTFLTITKKYTTGEPNFIETGHIEPAGLSVDVEKKVYCELKKALDALEITNSATHSEFKIDSNGDIRIVEIGARMGGDCIGSDLVQISTGYDFLKMVVDVAVGNKIDFKKIVNPKIAVIKFIFNEKDIKDFEIVKEKMNNKIYKVNKFKEVNDTKVTDSSSRFGFYILKVDNLEEVGWLFNEK